MVNSLRSFLKAGPLLLLAVFSCEERTWYQREFSAEEKKQYGKQLFNGAGYYPQGSVPELILLEESAELDSLNPDLWRELAAAPVKRGMAADWVEYYRKAIALDPARWQGWRGYLFLYFYRDYEKAIADFDATDTLTVDFVDYPQGQSVDYMRGICYYGLKDYDRALAYFSKYVESVIENEGEAWVDAYAVLYRALTLEKLGEDSRSLAELDRVLRIYPNLSDAFYHKARILAKNGNVKEAKPLVIKARENFEKGYYHQRAYVEVLEQIYIADIEVLEQKLKN